MDRTFRSITLGGVMALLVVGSLVVISDAALARGGTRDHRDGKRVGGSTEGGVTLNGQSAKPGAPTEPPIGRIVSGPYKGPATVRDHR